MSGNATTALDIRNSQNSFPSNNIILPKVVKQIIISLSPVILSTSRYSLDTPFPLYQIPEEYLAAAALLLLASDCLLYHLAHLQRCDEQSMTTQYSPFYLNSSMPIKALTY